MKRFRCGKFVEFKPNEYIKVTNNWDYWKKGRPYLDGIEYTIIRNLSTAVLGFVAGKFDMTFAYSLTVPLFNDAKSQLPQAICELTPSSINRNLLINRDKPPFDNRDLRRAMALSLDRQAFIDALPVRQAVKQTDGWYERVVEIDPDGSLQIGAAREPLAHFESTMPRVLRRAAIFS